jgi:diguanylate cyclase (GGDEF)-like protein
MSDAVEISKPPEMGLPLKELLAKKMAHEGSFEGKAKSALFWLDERDITHARNERINGLVFSAVRKSEGLEKDSPYTHNDKFEVISQQEDEGKDVELLAQLSKNGLKVEGIRAMAERLTDKDLGWEYRMNKDDSTDLFTRQFCVRTIHEFFEQYLLGGSDSAISFIDIDKLKQHNEQGYEKGDGAIQAVANALKASEGNVAGRFYSGDEDILVMPGVSTSQEVVQVMEKIRTDKLPEVVESIKTTGNPKKQIGTLDITFSYGYTTFSEVLEFLQETGINFQTEHYKDIIEMVVNRAIELGQTYQMIEKGMGRGKTIDQIKAKMEPRFHERSTSLIQHCFKKKGLSSV